ncbi:MULTISPECIES: glycoside hydrolase family 31 protein [Pontibacillus]|uniref:Glycoside hydrolase family 31 protein n=1 Tax=Pontibacillus chungwhensis TaxID=265426 RepID=A0ABY8UWQ9_9BACI|nr:MULTISPECIES: glycoside hydrolase family 31 protein [Pontibacillus]MCD5323440.1 glycoside hydrolase family 31 protein [Pontibacillus sp. HN14]WIF96819.1 glycoside hydrolase family 31 protein [Pontibacillus chungwhensis]
MRNSKTVRTLATASLATSLLIPVATPSHVLAVADVYPEKELNKEAVEKQKLQVQEVQKVENGVQLTLSNNYQAFIRLKAVDLAKVSILKQGEKNEDTAAINKTDWDTPSFHLEENETSITLSTDEITVSIHKEPFGVKFMDSEGNVINQDSMKYGSGYENGKPYVFKDTSKNEDFYGFGEQAGKLNKRGESIGMWNNDAYDYSKDTKYLYTTVPFFIGLKDEKAYGIFFDNSHRSYYEMASESDDYYYFYANDGQLTYYFAYGPEIQDVVNRYTELTGSMQRPPKWSLGLHQSKWGYKTADEIKNIVDTYREKDIPLDAVHLDIDHMNGFRNFTWGEDFTNDPKAFNDYLESKGVSSVAVSDPGIKKDPGYYMYDEGTENGYWATNPDGSAYVGEVWPGESVFPDFARKEVQDWWAESHATIMDAGVDGIWNDMNEPAVFDTATKTQPLDVQYGDMDHAEFHNMFAHYEAEATDQAFDVNKNNTRPFILTRDMYAGSQRYATLWTGDNASTWEALQMSTPMNNNVGLSGIPFVGNDIGGFAKRPSGELFARWLQMGMFNPFSRIHADNGSTVAFDTEAKDIPGQEPWQYGQKVEDISKKYIEMRYKLMPYLYNTFIQASMDGTPIQQPLVYQFQKDENTHDIDQQFMFGESLMVAPIVEKGATSKEVYLPKDEKWIDYWTGEEYKGGQTITKEADLSTIPLYVKKDSIIPKRNVQQYTGEKPLENLILDTYVEDQSNYTFIEDDGSTEDYQDGEFNKTQFHVQKQNKFLYTFNQDKKVESYNSELTSYTVKLHNVMKPHYIRKGDKFYQEVSSSQDVKETQESYYYDEDNHILYTNIPSGEEKEVKMLVDGTDKSQPLEKKIEKFHNEDTKLENKLSKGNKKEKALEKLKQVSQSKKLRMAQQIEKASNK